MKLRSFFMAACLGLGATAQAQTLPDDIDISTSPDGVVQLPSSVSSVFTNVFDRYTKIMAPNGQAIHLLMQSNVTDEMARMNESVNRQMQENFEKLQALIFQKQDGAAAAGTAACGPRTSAWSRRCTVKIPNRRSLAPSYSIL